MAILARTCTEEEVFIDFKKPFLPQSSQTRSQLCFFWQGLTELNMFHKEIDILLTNLERTWNRKRIIRESDLQVFVKDVVGHYLGCDASSQVLNSFSWPAAVNSIEVSMSLGECFLQKRDPSLLRMGATGVEQSVGVALERLTPKLSGDFRI